jgi:hypothetical protein
MKTFRFGGYYYEENSNPDMIISDKINKFLWFSVVQSWMETDTHNHMILINNQYTYLQNILFIKHGLIICPNIKYINAERDYVWKTYHTLKLNFHHPFVSNRLGITTFVFKYNEVS